MNVGRIYSIQDSHIPWCLCKPITILQKKATAHNETVMKVERILAGKESWLLVLSALQIALGPTVILLILGTTQLFYLRKMISLHLFFGGGRGFRLDWLMFLSLPTKTIPINTEIIAEFHIEREADLSYGSGNRNGIERNLEGGNSGALFHWNIWIKGEDESIIIGMSW